MRGHRDAASWQANRSKCEYVTHGLRRTAVSWSRIIRALPLPDEDLNALSVTAKKRGLSHHDKVSSSFTETFLQPIQFTIRKKLQTGFRKIPNIFQ
jgi:hypothetical protein